MNWDLILQGIYILAVIATSLRIIWDTRSHSKTIAYLMLVIFFPIIGMIIYFAFGVNYRKRKIYDKKLFQNKDLRSKLEKQINSRSKDILSDDTNDIDENNKLVKFLIHETLSPVTANNKVKLLVNGETKFPEVFKAIESAKDHIHVEYYIFADDEIGCEFVEALIKKAKEGVKVRFIYDDFGSRSIRKKQVPRLKEAGVEAFSFYKIKLIAFANRINYRNHRKIIVVDGATAFVGGINVSDHYVNKRDTGNDKKEKKKALFWRDTHLMLQGPAVAYLQYTFITDWNYCSESTLAPDDHFFPKHSKIPKSESKIMQIAASGPDSDLPNIKFSLCQAIHQAEEEILITTPYFIPGESVMDTIIMAANSGVKVKLLVPAKSDSKIVDAAARSYYTMLLAEGVEIYLYEKGFIHAKTMVTDKKLSIIGTANMDIRSFDLNFEVNALVYDEEFAKELCDVFEDDLKYSKKIDPEKWMSRPKHIQLIEKTAGLLSPML
ncbi:cardiolipin synthase [Changchengzhania lutea]|uniref:cardiolipin synthase n=1 Tax=Changchengzhania lutea TaxID=2049305 RepID=UPI00115E5D43|nr:cardiolipin synthase [Changchengzhania lutea]